MSSNHEHLGRDGHQRGHFPDASRQETMVVVPKSRTGKPDAAHGSHVEHAQSQPTVPLNLAWPGRLPLCLISIALPHKNLPSLIYQPHSLLFGVHYATRSQARSRSFGRRETSFPVHDKWTIILRRREMKRSLRASANVAITPPCVREREKAPFFRTDEALCMPYFLSQKCPSSFLFPLPLACFPTKWLQKHHTLSRSFSFLLCLLLKHLLLPGLCCKKESGSGRGEKKNEREAPLAEQQIFTGRHFETTIILVGVRGDLRSALGSRDREERLRERGWQGDHPPEHFARLLLGCQPPERGGPGEEMATLRNQAVPWLFWEEGLSVSEACALRVGAVALHQGSVRLSGPGAKERRIALGQESQCALGLDLARLSQQGEALGAETWLFRTERGDRMTNNAVTLLFARINQRAGMADVPIPPSQLRETFAVRSLPSGGQVQALQTHVGLHDRNSIKRFQQAAGLREWRPATTQPKMKNPPC